MSHIGKVRKSNQDAIYLNSRENLFIVADGIGGHRGGDTASKMAISLIPEKFLSQNLNNDNIPEHLLAAIDHAHRCIKEKAGQKELSDMGTTAVVAYYFNKKLYLANVGDSRCYLVQGHDIFQLTRDHSLIQEKLNLGIYTREQAAKDPARSVLVKSLGHNQECGTDLFLYRPTPGDLMLLCSDGLYGDINEDEMVSIIHTHLPKKGAPTKSCLEKAVKNLIDLANERGGTDNASLIISSIAHKDQVH